MAVSLPLYERFRPLSWAGVIGQDRALRALDCVRRLHGTLAGQVYWLAGPSGTGKTTIARLIAAEVGQDWTIEEIDAADLDVDTTRRWVRQCQSRPLGGGHWVFIINEAHTLRGPIVSKLQTALEDPLVQRNSTWCFTTTDEGESLLFDKTDGVPFLSRAKALPMARQGLAKPFAAWLRAKAAELGLNGKPESAYVRLLQDCKNNLRAALQQVECGAMLG